MFRKVYQNSDGTWSIKRYVIGVEYWNRDRNYFSWYESYATRFISKNDAINAYKQTKGEKF